MSVSQSSLGATTGADYELSNSALRELIANEETQNYENNSVLANNFPSPSSTMGPRGPHQTRGGQPGRNVSSPKTIATSTHSIKGKSHRFSTKTFLSPVKCNLCTSLLIGLSRQGLVCEDCNYACHVSCVSKVSPVCPIPPDQTNRPLGIDPTRGIGTAYEGFVKIPRVGGVKKGWTRAYVVVCDFKLFLFDVSPDRNNQPFPYAAYVLDMRDDDFAVNSVTEQDVIHANKRDLPCIFRITTSQIQYPASMEVCPHSALFMVDSESEKTKWVIALNELHRILRKSKLPDKKVYAVKVNIDEQLYH